MRANSGTVLTEKDVSIQLMYSMSEKNTEDSGWIQPPVSQQAIDLSAETLIDGIYVRSSGLGDVSPLAAEADIERALDRMAADPNIQREIRAIEAEFSFTEADGLTD